LSIVLLLNPRSRANRRDPHLAGRLAALLGKAGRVAAPESLEQLSTLAAELAADPPTAFAVHGGDGTLHITLTALLQAFGERPLPPVAILPGGTMNVVSASLHLQGPPEALVAQLVAQSKTPTGPTTIARRCLRVQNRFGFVFANGFMANFLKEYYGAPHYGTRRAVWLLASSSTTAPTTTPPALRRWPSSVHLWGWPWTCWRSGAAAASPRSGPLARSDPVWSWCRTVRTSPTSTPWTAICTRRPARWMWSSGPPCACSNHAEGGPDQ